MPDWNPAEMIGIQPSNLTYSIYSKLITDNSWSKAREEMGYTSIKEPLMYSFTGKPYIDTRLSFASLIPKNIPKKSKFFFCIKCDLTSLLLNKKDDIYPLNECGIFK